MQLCLQGIKAARIIWIVCIYLYCCSEAASPFVCVSISFLDWSCTWKKCFKPFKGQDFTWLGVFCKWLLNPFAVLELSLPLALQAAGLESARLPISVAHQMFTHRDGPCKEGRRKSSFSIVLDHQGRMQRLDTVESSAGKWLWETPLGRKCCIICASVWVKPCKVNRSADQP